MENICKRSYEIRVEGTERGEVASAYTPEGDYIGSAMDAYSIVCEHCIKPEKISPDYDICTIGFCEKDQKWYAWRESTIVGFGIGSSIKRNSLAYRPDGDHYDEIISELSGRTLWDKRVIFEVSQNGVKFSYQAPVYKTNPEDGTKTVVPDCYKTIEGVEPYGRGEWEAKTLDDARVMACDFAESLWQVR